jgi:hypothetical protein
MFSRSTILLALIVVGGLLLFECVPRLKDVGVGQVNIIVVGESTELSVWIDNAKYMTSNMCLTVELSAGSHQLSVERHHHYSTKFHVYRGEVAKLTLKYSPSGNCWIKY